jgi:YD repeat-containing protein
MPSQPTTGSDPESGPPDIRGFVELLEHAIDDADLARTTEAVRADPRAPEVLAALARVRDPEIRGFVPRAARVIMGRDAVPLLRRLVDDPDPDIRGMALHELEALDPALLAPLIAKLHQRVARSSDADEVQATGWTLVRLRDLDAIPLLEAHRARHEPWTWQAKAAEVQVLALRDPAAVIERIRDHDHDRMFWLAYAATIIGTLEAIDAVRACARHAPDEDCRRDCTYVLKSARAQLTE